MRREFLRRRFLKAMTLGAAALLDHLGDDLGARDDRRCRPWVAAAADHQHLGELDLGAGVAGDLLDGQDLVGGHAVLLAAGLDDSVHA